MNANDFWTYANNTMEHLLCTRDRWTRINNWLRYVSSMNFADYTVAKQGFDACVYGK